MRTLIVLLLVVPILAVADSRPWMMKERPEQLHHLYKAKDCPFESSRIDEIVKGVLVRSRIGHPGQPEVLNLIVDVKCGPRTIRGEEWLYVISVDFLRSVEVTGETYWARMHPNGYSAYGVAILSDVESEILELVEYAIADYNQANSIGDDP